MGTIKMVTYLFRNSGVPTAFALLSILGAFGVAYAILYRASTTNVGRRRRRGIEGYRK